MKLKAFKRSGKQKSEVNRIRYELDIPGVVYGPKFKNAPIFVKGDEFFAILRKVPKGRLATTVFDLEIDGKSHKAIVKDIQYHPTTYKIIHLDFEAVDAKIPVHVKVPIEFEGVADCAGVKLGGFLRQVIRSVKVKTFVKDIPEYFPINVKDMNIADSKKLKDLSFPKGVEPQAKLDEVIAIVAKR